MRVPGHTRNNIKLLDEAAGDTTDINLPGLMPLPVHLAQLQTVLATEAGPGSHRGAVRQPAARHAGPTPTARSSPSLNRQGARVILDTGGKPLRAVLGGDADALPWAIKPNQEELEESSGQSFSDIKQMAEAAHALCNRGIGLVVISRGAEGALFVSERHALLGRPPILQVPVTVGAGDALVAGLVAALVEKSEPERVARMALSFAAAKLEQEGPTLPNREAVLAQFDAMAIDRLDASFAA